jgi:hypothetical protein
MHALQASTLTTLVIFQTPAAGSVGVCEATCAESPAARTAPRSMGSTQVRDDGLERFIGELLRAEHFNGSG